jgi:putative tryptophan/tyrosine transport system substrate-binding protein
MRRREFIALCAGLGCFPRVALAQTASVRHLAFVHPATPVSMLSYEGARASGNKAIPAFLDELRRSGFVEGQNLSVARYSGQGQTDRYAELAREVVASSPDAIFTMTARMVRHFKALIATIPIVALTSDPVINGFAESLARPRGNITGVVPEPAYSVLEKRFEMIRETLPNVRIVAVLAPEAVLVSAEGREWEQTAQGLGLKVVAWGLKSPISPAEYERVFKLSSAAPVDAVVVGDSAENFTHRALIARLARDARLLGIYPNRNYAEAGGVIGYGPDYAELLRYAAAAVAKVFAGTPPGEIPLYQAQRFEVVLNLKVANEIGVKLPTSLLVRADEVIE